MRTDEELLKIAQRIAYLVDSDDHVELLRVMRAFADDCSRGRLHREGECLSGCGHRATTTFGLCDSCSRNIEPTKTKP